LDGVYIGLDRTYYANQSFTILFSINDRGLLTESTGSWGINFTPGWYDNAVIGIMDINLDSPISPSEYTLIPRRQVSWKYHYLEKTNLPAAISLNVSFSSTDGSFILRGAMPVTTNITSIATNKRRKWYFHLLYCRNSVIFLAIVIHALVKQSKPERHTLLLKFPLSVIKNIWALRQRGGSKEGNLKKTKIRLMNTSSAKKIKFMMTKKQNRLSDYAEHTIYL